MVASREGNDSIRKSQAAAMKAAAAAMTKAYADARRLLSAAGVRAGDGGTAPASSAPGLDVVIPSSITTSSEPLRASPR